jgi:hypothetical protein
LQLWFYQEKVTKTFREFHGQAYLEPVVFKVILEALQRQLESHCEALVAINIGSFRGSLCWAV